jgi:hypothetical protein
MKLEPRQQLPNITIDIRHFLDCFDHVLQPGIIERLTYPELQMFPALNNSHGLCMCNLACIVRDVQTMIEFVPQRRGMVESIDQLG